MTFPLSKTGPGTARLRPAWLLFAALGGCAIGPASLNGPLSGSLLYGSNTQAPQYAYANHPPTHPSRHHRHTSHHPITTTPAQLTATPLPPPAAGQPPKTYYVPVTAMPWTQTNGHNQAYKFGYPNGTAPVTIPLSAAPGSTITIQPAGGSIAIGPGGPPANAGGYPGMTDATGPLGDFPSRYIPGTPTNLGALLGTFTDNAGNITGTPFAIGTSKTTQTIPPNATQLQLGINDDVFGGNTPATRNSGGFTVQVTTP